MKPAPSTTPKPTGIEAKILFARFYESIKAFYEDPENRRRFEEWQKARESETKKCQMSANYKIFTRKMAEKGVTPYRVSRVKRNRHKRYGFQRVEIRQKQTQN
jgi:hypothetical protein